jgi:hypothetical protein
MTNRKPTRTILSGKCETTLLDGRAQLERCIR